MPTMPIEPSAVENALRTYLDPERGRDVVQLKQVRDITVSDGSIRVELALTSLCAPIWDELADECREHLKKQLGTDREIQVDIVEQEHACEPKSEFNLKIKKMIAVGSGKGGVGKSTVASLLALGFAKRGAKVGLLDADIYGPSVHHLLGSVEQPGAPDGTRIHPVEIHGLKALSMGMMMPADQAVMWRGPMLHGALTQFFRDIEWGELDYLIVDMPPGTGDVPMSLSQLVPLAGAVVVCTPQPVALIDAVRAVGLLQHTNIRVLGMVENMSEFICPDCNSRHEIFGHGGAAKKADQLGIPLLGQLPLNIDTRNLADMGRMDEVVEHPAVVDDVDTMCRSLVRLFVEEHRKKPPMTELPVIG